jgi:CRISPR/Cas system Type II protein with McrA/HNH and RuvC-like nuclease domain
MPAPTPGYVKNMIRRSLREVVDPSPSKKDEQRIWEFFNSECAYCGKKIHKENKEGHIDHLISCSKSGSNQINNRVLSCASCNEKEKLDMHWEEFLAQKNPNKNIFIKRKEKILAWKKLHKQVELNENVLEKIESIGNEVAVYYEEKIKVARELQKKY